MSKFTKYDPFETSDFTLVNQLADAIYAYSEAIGLVVRTSSGYVAAPVRSLGALRTASTVSSGLLRIAMDTLRARYAASRQEDRQIAEIEAAVKAANAREYPDEATRLKAFEAIADRYSGFIAAYCTQPQNLKKSFHIALSTIRSKYKKDFKGDQDMQAEIEQTGAVNFLSAKGELNSKTGKHNAIKGVAKSLSQWRPNAREQNPDPNSKAVALGPLGFMLHQMAWPMVTQITHVMKDRGEIALDANIGGDDDGGATGLDMLADQKDHFAEIMNGDDTLTDHMKNLYMVANRQKNMRDQQISRMDDSNPEKQVDRKEADDAWALLLGYFQKLGTTLKLIKAEEASADGQNTQALQVLHNRFNQEYGQLIKVGEAQAAEDSGARKQQESERANDFSLRRKQQYVADQRGITVDQLIAEQNQGQAAQTGQTEEAVSPDAAAPPAGPQFNSRGQQYTSGRQIGMTQMKQEQYRKRIMPHMLNMPSQYYEPGVHWRGSDHLAPQGDNIRRNAKARADFEAASSDDPAVRATASTKALFSVAATQAMMEVRDMVMLRRAHVLRSNKGMDADSLDAMLRKSTYKMFNDVMNREMETDPTLAQRADQIVGTNGLLEQWGMRDGKPKREFYNRFDEIDAMMRGAGYQAKLTEMGLKWGDPMTPEQHKELAADVYSNIYEGGFRTMSVAKEENDAGKHDPHYSLQSNLGQDKYMDMLTREVADTNAAVMGTNKRVRQVVKIMKSSPEYTTMFKNKNKDQYKTPEEIKSEKEQKATLQRALAEADADAASDAQQAVAEMGQTGNAAIESAALQITEGLPADPQAEGQTAQGEPLDTQSLGQPGAQGPAYEYGQQGGPDTLEDFMNNYDYSGSGEEEEPMYDMVPRAQPAKPPLKEIGAMSRVMRTAARLASTEDKYAEFTTRDMLKSQVAVLMRIASRAEQRGDFALSERMDAAMIRCAASLREANAR
jgi:hypothetical protein